MDGVIAPAEREARAVGKNSSLFPSPALDPRDQLRRTARRSFLLPVYNSHGVLPVVSLGPLKRRLKRFAPIGLRSSTCFARTPAWSYLQPSGETCARDSKCPDEDCFDQSVACFQVARGGRDPPVLHRPLQRLPLKTPWSHQQALRPGRHAFQYPHFSCRLSVS